MFRDVPECFFLFLAGMFHVPGFIDNCHGHVFVKSMKVQISHAL